MRRSREIWIWTAAAAGIWIGLAFMPDGVPAFPFIILAFLVSAELLYRLAEWFWNGA